MKDKSLSKLSRIELLNILYEQQKRIEELEKENSELNQKLEDKQLKLKNIGSIADASLSLTKIFEEAQRAADLYLYNVKKIAGEGKVQQYAATGRKQPVMNNIPVNRPTGPVERQAAAVIDNRQQVQNVYRPEQQPDYQIQSKHSKKPENRAKKVENIEEDIMRQFDDVKQDTTAEEYRHKRKRMRRSRVSR
ncbi:MAG: hypothetical protein IJI92_01780 [Erysipelotrichaceae bacterium]|nr:hypothetical protein [Erysipelotrichaceae bacterium]